MGIVTTHCYLNPKMPSKIMTYLCVYVCLVSKNLKNHCVSDISKLWALEH